MEYKKHCQYCNKEFTSTRKDARFCGDSCRNRFNNDNKAKEQDAVTLRDVMNELREIRLLLSARDEKVLSVEETCKLLNISKQTFDRLVTDGSIRLHRFGKGAGTGRGRKPFVLFSEIVATLKMDENGTNRK